MDYFAMLQVPRQPWIDADSLKENFLRLATPVHPDKVHQAPEPEKVLANRSYAELNSAYRCLAEPRDRLRHLVELESGSPPTDVQTIPPQLMNLLMETGQTCRGADAFLTSKAQVTSPLMKVQLFQQGMTWTDKLTVLRQQIDLRRTELLSELKSMNAAWLDSGQTKPLARVEELYRVLSYTGRAGSQVQERLVQLSL